MPHQTTTPHPPALKLRVTIADTWEVHRLEAAEGESVEAVKRRALAAARIDPAQASRYEVKFGGALVRDEARALAELGVRSGAPLVVLSRRRRPVR